MQIGKAPLLILLAVSSLAAACAPAQSPEPTSTTAPTPTKAPSPTPVPPSSTPEPTPTATQAPTATPTPQLPVSPEILVGVWGGPDGTNAAGFFIFREDGTWAYELIAMNESYSIDIFEDSNQYGTWEVDGDILILHSDENTFTCAGTTATYHVFMNDQGVIRFESIDEPCQSRERIFREVLVLRD